MSSLESHKYPIKKTLCFNIDDIFNVGNERKFSKPVNWLDHKFFLVSKIDFPSSDSLEECKNSKDFNEDEPCLQVDLRFVPEIRRWHRYYRYTRFRIIHQNTSKSITGGLESLEYHVDNFVLLTNLSKLISDGFVNNRSVRIECDIEIINFCCLYVGSTSLLGSRPDFQDVKSMFQNTDYQPTKKSIETEINLNELSEEITSFNIVHIDGIPCKIGFLKKDDSLNVRLFLNCEDKSEWWRVLAAAGLHIFNEMEPNKSIHETILREFDSHKNMCDLFGFINWDELISFSKNLRISIRVTIHILEKYGFDEETGRGIEKPMKKMRDAVITVGEEKFHVSRMILSHQSEWFCDLFSENPQKTEFSFDSFDGKYFRVFLLLIYIDVIFLKNEYEVKQILELLDKFRAFDCMKRLDGWLVDKTIINDWEILKLIVQYQLPKMKKKYSREFQDPEKLRKLFSDPDVVKISDLFRKELTMKEIPKIEENDDELFYDYSKTTKKNEKIPMEKFQKFLRENGEAKKLMEDPECQNQGNQIISILSEKPKIGKISFKEFSDPNDMLLLNFKDNKSFYSSKQILADVSEYFMKRFFGLEAKDDDNTIIFDDITSEHFNVLLNHIYHKWKVVTESNVHILLPLAHRFSIRFLLVGCEDYLLETENIPLEKREEYAQKYNLEWLSSAFINYKEKHQSSS